MALNARISKVELVEEGGSIKDALARETGIPPDRLEIVSVGEDASSPHYLVIYKVKEVDG